MKLLISFLTFITFFSNDQQDAQEFLLTVLDGLHEDLNIPKNRQYFEMPDFDKNSFFTDSFFLYRGNVRFLFKEMD